MELIQVVLSGSLNLHYAMSLFFSPESIRLNSVFNPDRAYVANSEHWAWNVDNLDMYKEAAINAKPKKRIHRTRELSLTPCVDKVTINPSACNIA